MFPTTTQFEKLLEAVPDALVGVDQKGVIRFVNRQTEHLFGYERDQLIGEPIDMLVPEPLWQVYAEHRQNYFADPSTRSLGLDLELSGRHEDGGEFPINVTMSLIDTGDVLLVITGVEDVSLQKQAVAKAEFLDAIVGYADDAIMGLTLDGIVTSWNPAAERMYGYSAAEMIGKSGGLLTPQDRAGELKFIMDRIRDDRHVEHAETTLVRKDGTSVPVSIAAAPIRSEHGTVVGASCVHRDVTRQRQAFEAAQRMAAIVQSSDEAIISRTVDGIITSWNPAAARMFGYSSEEIIGRPITVLIPADRAGEVITHLAQISADQRVDIFETMRLRKDGTAFPAALTVSPIRDANDAVVGASVIYRDVSELRQAALYARSLLEAALDPLVTISPEGKINDVNEATVRATGVPRNKLIGTNFSEYFTDPGKAHEGYEQVFAQGSVTDYPLTLRHRDGTQIDVLYNGSIYRDSDGEVLGVFAAARDVTDQKKAFELAEQMAAIVEGAQDAIMSSTVEGIITSWNPAAERMYGYSGDEVIGKPATLLAPNDRPGEIQAVMEQVRLGRGIDDLETKRVRKNGAVFPVSLTVSPIRQAGGAITGVSVIVRDLSDQKGALVLAQRMAAIVEYSDDAIIGRTLDGIITSWNPAAQRMFGYSSQEIVGKHIDHLIPPERAAEMISILAKISSGSAVNNFETTRIRKDGTLFPVSLTVSPIRDENGRVAAASVIYRDVSELKQAAQYTRSLIEASLDPLETISPEGKITDVNEAAVKVSGIPRNKLIGSDFSSYFTDPAKARQGYQRVFDLGSVTDYPLTVRHSDGTLTDVLCNASLYRDTAGNVIGVLAAARDMTSQKEGFEAAQRMAAIAEYSQDAIISNTLDGTITGWNPAAERMFGYSSQEIVGRSGSLLSPQDRIGEVKDILTKVSQGRPVDNFETICTRKDGTTFPVKVTLTPIRDAGGTIVGASAIVRDVYAVARHMPQQT
jgi:PAS domain S-box-containing protein